MRLSEKKKDELYSAIADTIMDERIKLQRYGSCDSKQMDGRLFKMQNDIWRKIHKVLNIDGTI